MSRVPTPRRALTNIELLVVIGIISILIALLLPAVQNAREAANRAICRNNLHQIALAVHHFHDANERFPPYFGIFNPAALTTQNTNPSAVYGGWLAHLLPYIEQQPLYEQIQNNITLAKKNTGSASYPASGTLVSPATPKTLITPAQPGVLVSPAVPAKLISPAVPAKLISPAVAAVYDYSQSTYIPAVPAHYQWVLNTNYNGFNVWSYQQVPATAAYWSPPPILVSPAQAAVYSPAIAAVYSPATAAVYSGASAAVYSPAQPAVYDPPDSGPYSGAVGIAAFPDTTFLLLQCPSDPSATNGQVLSNSSPIWGGADISWGSTNYLANWHALGDSTGDGSLVFDPAMTTWGYWSQPQKFARITDGASNTILFAEGYAYCDTTPRIALHSWYYHNFGITWNLIPGQIDPTTNIPNANCPYGLPNTFLFQVKPLPVPHSECPPSENTNVTAPPGTPSPATPCCVAWQSQTPHAAMQAAMVDGSVQSITPGISQQTWSYMMLPRDGHVIDYDW